MTRDTIGHTVLYSNLMRIVGEHPEMYEITQSIIMLHGIFETRNKEIDQMIKDTEKELRALILETSKSNPNFMNSLSNKTLFFMGLGIIIGFVLILDPSLVKDMINLENNIDHIIKGD